MGHGASAGAGRRNTRRHLRTMGCLLAAGLLSAVADAQVVKTEVTTFSTANPTWTDVPGATLSFVPTAPSEKWVLLFSAVLRSDSNVDQAAEVRYLVNGMEHGRGGIVNTLPNAGGPWQSFYLVTGTAAPQTVTVQIRDASASGATTTIDNVRMIAWLYPTGPGGDVQYAETAGGQLVPDGAWVDRESLTFTPLGASPVCREYLVMAQAVAERSELRLGTPISGDWPDLTAPGHWVNPGTSLETFMVFRAEPLSSGSQTFRLQAFGGPGGGTLSYARILALRVAPNLGCGGVTESVTISNAASEFPTNSTIPVTRNFVATPTPVAPHDVIVLQNLMVNGSPNTYERRATFRVGGRTIDSHARVLDDGGRNHDLFYPSYSSFEALTAVTSLDLETTHSTSTGAFGILSKEAFQIAIELPTASLAPAMTTHYRSIGTAGSYSLGTVAAANGSVVVNGAGTTWQASRRGRGDVITMPCFDPPACSTGQHYTIDAVDSDTSLRLTEPYGGSTSPGLPYLIRRQFTTLQGWENCISGAGGCVYFPVPSSDLVVDNRSEVGVAYDDSPFLLGAPVVLNGSTTDPNHTIRLTAARPSRHLGFSLNGVIVDGLNGPNGIQIMDDYVTVEWLELKQVRPGATIEVLGAGGPTGVLLQNLLIHDYFAPGAPAQGILLSGNGGKSVTVRNTMIWDGDGVGIEGDEPTDSLTIQNVSIHDVRDINSRGIWAMNTTVQVFNTIVTGSTLLDFDPGGGGGFLGSDNTSSDPSAPGPNPQPLTPPAALFQFLDPGPTFNHDLHLVAGPNPAVDTGFDLAPAFHGDVDGELRPVNFTWDRGADEVTTGIADLQIMKDDGFGTSIPGMPISYAITVTNNGPDAVDRVIVTDPIPPQLLGAYFSTANGVYSAGTGEWVFAAPLSAGQSAILQLDATVDPSATVSLTNTATVTLPPGPATDPVPANDTDMDFNALSPEADLEVTKTHNADPIDIGNTLVYTLTVTNHGPSDATGVMLYDTLVTDLEYQMATPSQGTCNYVMPNVDCTLGNMAAGSTVVVTLVVRPLTLGTHPNSATAFGNEFDPDSLNDIANELTTVGPASSCIVTTDIDGGDEIARGVVIQPDGRIVLGGSAFRTASASLDFTAVRYTPGLQLDGSYGLGGVVSTDVEEDDEALDLRLLSDGRLLVGGHDSVGAGLPHDDFTIVRYGTDGSIDVTFNPGGLYGEAPNVPGIVTTDVGGHWDLARGMALLPDGRFLMAGAVRVGGGPGTYDAGIVRYHVDGAVDTAFGTNGQVVIPIGANDDQLNALAVQPDGKVVAAGATFNGAQWDWVLVRYQPDGSLDGSFGIGGIVVTDLRGFNDWTEGVAIQPDGKIVVMGQSSDGSFNELAVARFDVNGSIDTTFNSTGAFGEPPNVPGMVFVSLGPGDDTAGAGLLQPNGQILVVGRSFNGINDDFAMVRLNPDGSLDGSFGIGGKVTTSIGGDNDEAHAVTLTPGGRILLAGRSYDPGGSSWDFALARYTPTGRLDPGCGSSRYRSIGTAPPLVNEGTISVTAGSTTVTKSGGLSWIGQNRGRGDVLLVGPDSYMVLSVDSDHQLTLATPANANHSGPYTLDRQFDTLQEWEDCISGGGPCLYFPVASNDLVADGRSEVGIAYKDSIYLLSTPLRIAGAVTDALHTITLTVDPGNRHDGRPGGFGVALDGQLLPNGIDIETDNVTLEWLEIIAVQNGPRGVIELMGTGGPTNVVLQNLVISFFWDPFGDMAGVRLSGSGGKTLTIRNSVIVDGDEFGIEGDEASDRIVVENVSIDGMNSLAGRGIYAGASTIDVSNTIVTGSSGTDFDAGIGVFNGSHNTSSDATAPGPAFQHAVAPGSIFVSPGFDLHIVGGANPVKDTGLDLSFTSGFSRDYEGDLRPADIQWDRGADEFSPGFPDLGITKDDGLATAVSGTPITYVLTVTNYGPEAVGDVFIWDPPPVELLNPYFSTTNGSFDPGTGSWVFGSPLLQGQSVVLTLSGTIDPLATGTLSNDAIVGPPVGMVDPTPGNDMANDITVLTSETDLEILKSDDVDPIEVGNTLTYTLTVTNHGPSEATGVTVTDDLDPALDFLSAVPTQGGCGFTNPRVTCNLGLMSPGAIITIDIVVRTLAVGPITNTADVVGGEFDPFLGNNSATEATDIDPPTDGVLFFTATSTFQTNTLEWVNPGGSYVSTEIVFRTDRFPLNETDGTSIYNAGTAGSKDKFVHATGGGSNGITHYYGAFVHLAGPPFVSGGRFVTGRPFDNSGLNPSKWAFSTGAFSITPPTVGTAAVVAPAQDGVLYAMERGLGGGEWPLLWEPAQLGGAVQSRSPVIPLTMGGANPVVYLGAQDGNVYSVNGTTGGASPFPWGPTSIAGVVQAAPAAIFSVWGGIQSYLLVGTRDAGADNRLVAVNPDTPGNVAGFFDNTGGANGIGIINGMAAVDYTNGLVYFTSHRKSGGSNDTLWCLKIGPPGPVLDLVWSRDLGDIDSSPVLHGGRVYVGSAAGGGTVYSINAATGAAIDDRTYVHGDGQVKGFVWPDRASNDLYFAAGTKVWGVTDTGVPTMVEKWAGGVALGGGGVTPSTLLFVPGSHFIYVGGSDGCLWELDILPATPTQKFETLGDGFAAVGAPSLDFPNSLIHVGTEAGIFYAVEVPLP